MAAPEDGSDMDEGEGCDESDFDLNDDPQPSKWKRDTKLAAKKKDDKHDNVQPLPNMNAINHITAEELKHAGDAEST